VQHAAPVQHRVGATQNPSWRPGAIGRPSHKTKTDTPIQEFTIMKRMFVAMSLLTAIAVGSAPALAQRTNKKATAQSTEASLRVIHGINGADLGLASPLPVDVYVAEADACLLQGFEFTDIAGPLSLPAGVYTVTISLADATNPCGGPAVIGPAPLPLDAGRDYTAIAHLTDAGAPTASLFETPSDALMRGYSRLVAHHTAWAPAVDVLANRGGAGSVPVAPVLQNVSNGSRGSLDLRPGNWTAYLGLPGSGQPVEGAGPWTVTTTPNGATLVFVVGSLTNGLQPIVVDTRLVKPRK
jgi:hypothetical protein